MMYMPAPSLRQGAVRWGTLHTVHPERARKPRPGPWTRLGSLSWMKLFITAKKIRCKQLKARELMKHSRGKAAEQQSVFEAVLLWRTGAGLGRGTNMPKLQIFLIFFFRMFRVGRDLCRSSSPPLLPKQGHPEQAAWELVQAGLEYLQRRRLHNLPGQPVPGLRRKFNYSSKLQYIQ